MSRRVVLASMSLLLVAALASCSTKPAVTEAATGTTAEGSTTTAPSTPDTTSDAGSGDSTTSVPVGDLAAPAASRAGSCPTQDQVDAVQNELEAGSSGASSSDQLAAEYDAAFSFLAAYLPPERQADLELVRNAFSGYVQALSGVDLSNPEALTDDQYAALDAAGKAFDTPEVEAANSRIEDYFSQACPGVNFNDGSNSTGGTTPN
jgi:hypothetical protein